MTGFGEKIRNKKSIAMNKDQISGEDICKKAIDHHRRGDLENAEKEYRKAIEIGIHHYAIFSNLGVICKNSRRADEAVSLFKKAIEINPEHPDAYTNLGNLYRELCNFTQALDCTLKSLGLKPVNPDALINLGSIYKNLGNLDQALASTLSSLELKPDNPDALINLSLIYKERGELDLALVSILKTLELKPDEPTALSVLGQIKMAQAKNEEARELLVKSIRLNSQEYEAYFSLSLMLELENDAEELIELIKQVKVLNLDFKSRVFIEFALSNCFHKLKEYDQSAEYLKLANYHKSIVFPSNANSLQQEMAGDLLQPVSASGVRDISADLGKDRIFIVGMPRSGSTLLETVLSMSSEVKDLGETRSLVKAIRKFKQQKVGDSNFLSLNALYSQLEPISNDQFTFTTDKNLYNFMRVSWIATHMPAAKIIHCRRDPMDNILSMYRSNLSPGNGYTANLEDAARVLVAQEEVMQIQKSRHPGKIFTFDYDRFVNEPEVAIRVLLEWIGIDFVEEYIHPDRSVRTVNTASVMQARRPISNKSVGGWKKYYELLKPALRIIQEAGIGAEI